MSRCAAPKTYSPSGHTNSRRQDSAQLEVTGKTPISNDLLDWLPFLDTYRTLCVTPTPEFEEVLEEIRTRAA